MLQQFIDIIFHLDVHLAQWSAQFGVWIYVILFLIIFAETGLVITPFLPGDSLLFAAGALATLPESNVRIEILFITLVSAAFLGDNTNYQIGSRLGVKVFKNPKSLFLNPINLEKTQKFYSLHGAKTILFARFLPIFRTFAPFVAGVGRMNLKKFITYSLLGSLAWMGCFLTAGYFFGNLPSVKKHFHIVIFAVIGISFLPVIYGFVQNQMTKRTHS